MYQLSRLWCGLSLTWNFLFIWLLSKNRPDLSASGQIFPLLIFPPSLLLSRCCGYIIKALETSVEYKYLDNNINTLHCVSQSGGQAASPGNSGDLIEMWPHYNENIYSPPLNTKTFHSFCLQTPAQTLSSDFRPDWVTVWSKKCLKQSRKVTISMGQNSLDNFLSRLRLEIKFLLNVVIEDQY